MTRNNSYNNASLLLPKELLREVQKYFSGGTLYIPSPHTKKLRWGEKSGARQEYSARNRQIKELYRSGQTVENIATLFCISADRVRKILYTK